MAAAGFTGVWATENTREAIFDAMQRKEAYSTSGSRMLVRFFGGFDFVPADAQSRTPAEAGYSKGVPMGGDLDEAPAGKSPTFLVAALKDPIGAKSRPHPDREGLAWTQTVMLQEQGLRRGLGRGRRASRARTASSRRWATRVDIENAIVDQHDRRA